MALEKQTIPVAFTGGIDTKTTEETVLPGSFLVLENAVRRKHRRTQKRYGFSALNRSVISSSSAIDSGSRLQVFKSDLLLFNQTKVYSYIAARDSWTDKGEIPTATVESRPVVRNSDAQSMADIALLQGLVAYTWEDSRGGVRAAIVEQTTDTHILYDYELSATGVRPKVVAVGDYFLFVYIEPSTNFLRVRRVAVTNPATVEAASTVTTNVANKPWDISVFDQEAVFVVNQNSALALTIGYIAESGAIGSPAGNGLPNPVTFAEDGSDCLTIKAHAASQRIFISYFAVAASYNLRLLGITPDLVTTSVATVESVSPDEVKNVGLTIRDNDDVRVFYELEDTSVSATFTLTAYYVRQNTASWPGTGSITIGTPDYAQLSVGLASKPFTIGESEYVVVTHDSALQPTYFVVRHDGFVVAKIAPGLGEGLTRSPAGAQKSGLTKAEISDSAVLLPLAVKNQLQAATTEVLSVNKGINRVTLTFGEAEFNGARLGDNFHISGGILLAYDGVSAIEHGFHLFPENILLTHLPASGGVFPPSPTVTYPATINLRIIYEWTDGAGQIHRSAPSVTESISIAAATSRVQIEVETLRVTAKTGDRSDAKIKIFAAYPGLATVYYKIAELANDTTVDTVTYIYDYSTFSEASEVLYTTGGVLENIAAPASTTAVAHKRRMFLGGLEDENNIVYSKSFVDREGVAFSDLFQLRVNPDGGGVKVLATLDDKLVIFKKDRIYTLVGDGPLDTGAQNDYGEPQQVAGDVGTELPKSVVLTPDGLMFKSDKGIYLLSRALELDYVGAPVEAFNHLEVTSAVVLEDENEVRFTTSDGATLVYNYYFKQWSTFTNYQAISAISASGSYMHLKSDGTVNRETPEEYEDNGSRIKQALETSWFSFAGLQAFLRVYELAILGQSASNHVTKVKLAYDYENAYTETVYFNVGVELDQETYGEDAVYGDSEVYGGVGSGVYKFRVKPARQKCMALKVRLEDVDTIEDLGGATFALVAMSFEIGTKRGLSDAGFRSRVGS